MKIDYEYLSRIRRAVALYTKRKTTNILDGDFRSIHRGRSMEFDDLKEYTYGDDVHDIDWKSSSRMGSILVRRYMTDRRHNVLFICDRGRKFLGDTSEGESKKELMLMTFGTLAYIFGRNGADFALSYAGDQRTSTSYFKSGTDHLEKLIYDFEEKCVTDSQYGLNTEIKEIMDTAHKRMIIFLITDIEGLADLGEDAIRSITSKYDLMIINIDDAYLTGGFVYDNERSMYEKFFFSHSKALHEEEVRQRQDILSHVSKACKMNRACLTTISRQEDIIESTIGMLERYRNGYYG